MTKCAGCTTNLDEEPLQAGANFIRDGDNTPYNWSVCVPCGIKHGGHLDICGPQLDALSLLATITEITRALEIVLEPPKRQKAINIRIGCRRCGKTYDPTDGDHSLVCRPIG